MKYVAPSVEKTAFHCPRCNAYAQHEWFDVMRLGHREVENLREGNTNLVRVRYLGSEIITPKDQIPKAIGVPPGIFTRSDEEELKDFLMNKIYLSYCQHCRKESIWYGVDLVYPNQTTAPPAHEDMPEKVREVYEEARQVFPHSIRAACTLLRLSMEYLMDELNVLTPTDSLGKRLKHLIDEGYLNSRILKALESIRVYGNDYVHNVREIQVVDDQETALQLFNMVNFIIGQTITMDKQINELYDPTPRKRVQENQPQG